ncbi:hypothetical protein HXX01_03635 [Candidatus Nomurabacteria bacterium]|nr:hypothetical protein [Candidatus Nomurabacteria bacterium]
MSEAEHSSGEWKESVEYRLKPRAVRFFHIEKRIEILKKVRLCITGNQVDIILSGVLTAEPNKSRLKLLSDTIVALLKTDIIKGNLSTEESYRARSYKILADYFKLAEYEIRIDAPRSTGRSFYKFCKENKSYEIDFENTVYLASRTKAAYRQSGYQVITYDRALKQDARRKLKPSYFPIRLELRVKGKLLKEILGAETIGDICTGSSAVVINRLRAIVISKISASVKRVGAFQQFDLFCNGKHRGIAAASSLKELISERSLYSQLTTLHKLKLERGEPDFDIDALLRFHGYNMKRYFHFDQI